MILYTVPTFLETYVDRNECILVSDGYCLRSIINPSVSRRSSITCPNYRSSIPCRQRIRIDKPDISVQNLMRFFPFFAMRVYSVVPFTEYVSSFPSRRTVISISSSFDLSRYTPNGLLSFSSLGTEGRYFFLFFFYLLNIGSIQLQNDISCLQWAIPPNR